MLRSLRKAAQSLERNIDSVFSTGTGDDGGYVNREFTIAGIRVKLEAVFATGGFSYVHSARPVNTTSSCTTRYAVKRMSLADPEGEALARREIDFLTSLPQHQNIVHFYGAITTESVALLMFEMLDGGTLQEVLERRRGAFLAAPEILSIFHNAVAAVAHLHALDPPVACRDVKLENLLYDRLSGVYKLCDFGSCTAVAKRCVTRQEILAAEDDIGSNCSMMYRAPEMVDLYTKQFICERVDVWALGCIFFALLYGKLPFDGASSIPILRAAFEVPSNTPNYPEAFEKLLKAMLTPDPLLRADSFTILEAICRLRNLEMDPQLRERGRQLRDQRKRDFAPSLPAESKASGHLIPSAPAVQPPAHDFFAPTPVHAPQHNASRTGAPVVLGKDGDEGWADFDSAFAEEPTISAEPTSTPVPVPGPRPLVPGLKNTNTLKPMITTPLYKIATPPQSASAAVPARATPWGGPPMPGPAPVKLAEPASTSGTWEADWSARPAPSTMPGAGNVGSQGLHGRALDLNVLYGATGRTATSSLGAKYKEAPSHSLSLRSRVQSNGQPQDMNSFGSSGGRLAPSAPVEPTVARPSVPPQKSGFGVRPGSQALDLQMLYEESATTNLKTTSSTSKAVRTAKDDKDEFADLSDLMMGLRSVQGKK